MKDRIFFRWVSEGVLCSAVLAALPFAAMADGEAADEERAYRNELHYIDVLQRNGYPDIAEEVIAEVRKRFPAAVAALRKKEIDGMLTLGKFDEVQKLIDAVSDKNGVEYWTLNLSKGSAYFNRKMTDEGRKIFDEFFKKHAKPSGAMLDLYRRTAYEYYQRLLMAGQKKAALQVLNGLVKQPMEEDQQRDVTATIAEVATSAAEDATGGEREQLLKEAEASAAKLLWKTDMFFGKAIAVRAHAALLRGKNKDAEKLVEEYMPMLKNLHDEIRRQDPDGSNGYLRYSPIPECRYLLGKMQADQAFKEAAKKDANDNVIKDLLLGSRDKDTNKRSGGAFSHFINIYARYPESQWAGDSGEYAERIVRFIKTRYGVEIKTRITPEQMAQVRKMQFADANGAFASNQHADAIKKFLKVLNQFPECEEAVNGLRDLALSYMEDSAKDVDAQLNADTVTWYLADRFCTNPKFMKLAGDNVRAIAERYGEMKRDDKRRECYTLFFDNFKSHYAAPQLVMSFGEREYKAGNLSEALGYYQRLVKEYPESGSCVDAMHRIAQVYADQGNITNQIEALVAVNEKLAAREKPGHALAVAKFKLANAYRELGVSAVKEAANPELPEEQKDALRQSGVENITKAAGMLESFIKDLTAKATDFQRTQDERDRNQKMLEAALFSRAVCMTQINFPKEKVEEMRPKAVAAFEDYIEKFPKGQFAPQALVQIGTLYTVMKDAQKSQAAFDRLAKDYPSSEEAKNSVPMLAAALIDMGLRGEGVAKYRQMFSAGGKYTDGQFMSAAKALEGSREYALAMEAYDKVAASTKDLGYKANALLGKARALNHQKKYAEAHQALDQFLADKQLSRLQQMVDANMLLVDVASAEGMSVKDDDTRTKMFNVAIDAIKKVRGYANSQRKNLAQKMTPEEFVQDKELQFLSSQVLVRRMMAEKQVGLEEKAAKTRGEACAGFTVLLSSLDPGLEAARPVLEKTYATVIPLLLEHKSYEDAETYCKEYLELFKDGQHTTDVKNWLNQATNH
ncbi:MAG: tetratricopeptide repeat protein [Kiritimatiellae bacterium]|nr:tetratricopeptide repeat protein [Kiritimatiellia bacterium]